jgi:Zn-dependent protease with chaperone function
MERPRLSGAVGKLRLSSLVAEGYAYLLLTILVFAGAVAFLAWGLVARRPLIGLTALFVGGPVLLAAGSAIRSLLFRLPEPRGHDLSPCEAPALLAMIEEVRLGLAAPRIDRILIAGAANASAVQIPRCILFWPRNLLVIGYPLLLILSPEQLKAVIAHELAHLFHGHGTVAGWVHRTRLSWSRLAEALEERGIVPIFVRWILTQYLPRLELGAAAIGREHETLADACAAEVAGRRSAADALVAIELGHNYLQQVFWPGIFGSVGDGPEPPHAFARMRCALAGEIERHASAGLLELLLEDETDLHATHPSLRDRLRTMGEPARIPAIPARSAAEVYLGSFSQPLSERLDREWRSHHADEWRKRHDQIASKLARLACLEGQAQLSADQACERGRILEELGRGEDALAAFLEVADGRGHLPSALAAGRMLLRRGDSRAAGLIERAVEDERLGSAACELLYGWHREQGRLVEAQRYRALAARFATRASIAEEEREKVTHFDRLGPHDLGPEQLAPLLAALQQDGRISRALLARKHLRHSGGSLLVLGLVAYGAEAAELAVRTRLQELLSAEGRVILLDRAQRAVQTALQAVPGAEIYSRR